jgi:hypothetical protein
MIPTSRTNASRILPFVLISAFLLVLYFSRILFLPKLLAFLLVIAIAAMLRRFDDFLRNWFLFLSFVYLSDSLRGLIYILTCRLDLPVHTFYVLRGELALFGQIPSVILQQAFLRSGNTSDFSWLEKSLTVLHGTHFVVFLIVGFALWMRKSRHLPAFRVSFYILIGMGIAFYMIVPTVSPWIAAELFGLMPRLVHFNVMIYNVAAPGLLTGFNTNPISVMPSLHAGFAVLCSLILWKLSRWKSLPFQAYTLVVLFTIIYTGDHYVVDLLAGALLAVLGFKIGFAMRMRTTFHPGTTGNPSPAEVRRSSLIFFKSLSFVWGALLLTLGIAIGLFCQNQFEKYPENYAYTSGPRYADFFRHESEFLGNYRVQVYFGNYYLVRGDNARALGYFENALALSRTVAEKKNVEMKIRQCRARLK